MTINAWTDEAFPLYKLSKSQVDLGLVQTSHIPFIEPNLPHFVHDKHDV